MNGCNHHPDCFTCPFPDCIASSREVRVWDADEEREERNRKRREWRREKRMEELKKEFPFLEFGEDKRA